MPFRASISCPAPRIPRPFHQPPEGPGLRRGRGACRRVITNHDSQSLPQPLSDVEVRKLAFVGVGIRLAIGSYANPQGRGRARLLLEAGQTVLVIELA